MPQKFYYGLILLAVMTAMAGLPGCKRSASTANKPVAKQTPVDLDAKIPFESIKPVLLQVPFKAQVPPGDWAQTTNCNPACFVMILSHRQGIVPTTKMIQEFDDWALRELRKDHNNFSGVKEGYGFSELQKYAATKGIPGARTFSGNLPILIDKLNRGIPCIVSVKRKMKEEDASRHAMLVVGIDPQNIILHDPGRAAGSFSKYPLEQFLKVWRGGKNLMFCVE